MPIAAESLALAPFISIEQTAELFGCSPKTVRRMIAAGDLPASRLKGKRTIRIRSTDALSSLQPIRTAGFDR